MSLQRVVITRARGAPLSDISSGNNPTRSARKPYRPVEQDFYQITNNSLGQRTTGEKAYTPVRLDMLSSP